MMLKLKSLVYKYTGWFLAHKEENEYVDSDEYWKSFLKIAKDKQNDLSVRNIHGLLIGSWQAKHGFARPMSRRFFIHRFKYPKLKFLFWAIDWVSTLCIVLRWDLESLWYEIKK